MDSGFKGFYSRKYNQLHTSGICGLLRLTSIYITYFVRIKPLIYNLLCKNQTTCVHDNISKIRHSVAPGYF